MRRWSYEYEEKLIEYYLVTLKDVEFGPQLKRKSDYKEEDIRAIEKLIVRISDASFDTLSLKPEDIISFNGGVVDDNFIGLMVKRTTKLMILR